MSSPLSYLGSPPASTTTPGIVELATTAECVAGTNNTKACTPAGVAAVAIAGAPDASTTQKGIIEIATNGEAAAQTSGTLALVPSNIPSIMASPGDIGGTTPGAGTFTTLTMTDLVLTNPLSVSEGGTGLATITDHGVMLGSGTGAVTPMAVGTNNQIIIGQTGADPIWSNNLDLPGTLDVTGATTLDDTLSVAGTSALTGAITGSGGATLNGGVLNLGTDNAANAVNIGVGTTARSVSIANSAAAHVVAIGSTTGAASLTLRAGTGNFSLDGAATSTYTFAPSTTSGTINFGGTGANTGTMTIAGGTGAQTINVANSTGGKTINIGTGAGVNAVTIGSTNTTSATTINAGSGLITMAGKVALNSAAGPQVLAGSGSPDTAVTAPQGSLYLRTDGSSTSTRAYINTDGATAWTAVTTAT